MTGPDVVVVGGGVIGLSLAWRAATAGMAVTVCDPTPGRGSSWVAAGMLAPVTEATTEERDLTRMGLASIARWPRFAADLEEETGVDVGLRQDGTLQVAFDNDDRRALDHLAAVHHDLGLASERCSSSRCRALEPALSPGVRGGLFAGDDWQVDPRSVVAALREALQRRGVPVLRTAVRSVGVGPGGRATGVDTDDGEFRRAGAVVLAAGADSAKVAGVPDAARPAVRPVKGEILRLRAEPTEVPFTRTIRGSVQGRSVYLVPRLNGEVVVGATMQEAGYDTTVRAGAVHDLLHAAIDLVPAIEELRLVEAAAGLRPGSPDNAPLLGASGTPGLLLATGHFRNGVLLAPLTADALVEVLAGRPLPADAAAGCAGRFQ
ncbi:glycine oxidase ThiO [Acidiferrimicrobium sp. IK]|uniref:glycine oxidase ThiO n=1 Tax=Acidiferrimicrobium sp. IK TaxID=2871700 RepID=UPI0021CAF401|nr:glycine oxidase ThiO [Acidiferrimicrobium sp. IK]MCU4183510.1 glycine oxidase ThiO [Acidiferrimicrobium sp. IK]